MRELVTGRLPAGWRGPFEASYGRSFAHVAAVCGPEAERRLAAQGALALAVDEATILFSERLSRMPLTARLSIVGHELAHTVQLARGGTDATELLEAEAWRASCAALRGERFVVRGGARQEVALAAVGLMMDSYGVEYFKVFDTIGKTQVTKTEIIKPLTYEKLLDLFLDPKYETEKDYVIQAHGLPTGFYIPIIDKQPKVVNAEVQILRQLIKLDALIKAFQEAGDDLAKLNAVIEKHMGTDRAFDVETAKRTIGNEIGRQKARVGITLDEDIARVVKKMSDVQQKKRGRIELRTCSMGALKDTLDFYRLQFNADTLSAPNVLSAFGTCIPAIGARAMDVFANAHKAKGTFFPSGKDQFGFDFDDPSDPTFIVKTYSAASNISVIQSFVTSSLMGGKKFQPNQFPIHFLFTRPALFPLNPGYNGHIKESNR